MNNNLNQNKKKKQKQWLVFDYKDPEMVLKIAESLRILGLDVCRDPRFIGGDTDIFIVTNKKKNKDWISFETLKKLCVEELTTHTGEADALQRIKTATTLDELTECLQDWGFNLGADDFAEHFLLRLIVSSPKNPTINLG